MKIIRIITLLGLLVLVTTASCQHLEPQNPGLAKLVFGQKQFVYFNSESIQNQLEYTFKPEKINWPKDLPNHARRGWSTVLRGRLSIKEKGLYVFKGSGTDGRIRLGDAWIPLEGEHKLILPAGKLKFELYQKDPVKNRAIKGSLLWKTPEADKFSPIPPELLSHGKSDMSYHKGLHPDVLVKDVKTTFATLDGKFNIPEDGYYRFFLRCAGDFRWGNICPGSANILLDNKTFFFYGKKTGGFFDAVNKTRYLKAGEHTLEIMGDGSSKFVEHPAIRLGLYRVDPVNNANDTFAITQSPSGESVFKINKTLTWTFSRSTLDGQKRKYKVEMFPQRQGNAKASWSGEVELPSDRMCATASLTYPCDKEGAFEYKILNHKGEIIEGPWEIVVIDPTPLPLPKVGEKQNKPKLLVDTIDCKTEGPGGPHHFRDNGTSKIISNGKLKYRQSGGKIQRAIYHNIGWKKVKGKRQALKAEKYIGHRHHIKGKIKGRPFGLADLDWFGYTLQVKHPEKPHLIVAYLPNDKYRRIPVEALDPITGHHNGAFLEVLEGKKQDYVKLIIPFWPNDTSIDILTYPSSAYHGEISTPSAIAKIELYEYPNGLPALPESISGWVAGREVGWSGEQGNLSPEVRTTPRLWEGDMKCPQALTRQQAPGWKFYDYKAYSQAWSRFGEYSRWRGDNLLIWPIHSYAMAHVKTKRLPWGREPFSNGLGFRWIDKNRRDTMKIILLLCEKYGIDFIGDLQINSGIDVKRMTGLIAVTENASEDELKGLFLEGGRQYPARILNPAHPVARSFLIHFYGDIARKYGPYKAFKGINIRQWSWTSMVASWFKGFDVGYGDYTINLFEKETGIKVPYSAKTSKDKPGKTKEPEDVYKTRYDFLMSNKEIREKWFRWRSEKVLSLREAILAEMRKYAPQMKLYCGFVSPNNALGNGLDEELMNGRKDLGFDVKAAKYGVTGIEMNALDPHTMKNFDIRKGVKQLTPDEKLATGRVIYPTGMNTAGAIVSPPYTTGKIAKALAKTPLDVINAGAFWALPPSDNELQNWIQTWRAIPELKYKKLPGAENNPVVCWQALDDSHTIAYLVNVTNTKKQVNLKLSGSTSAIMDMVNGESVKPSKIIVPPFSLRLLKLQNVKEISGLHLEGTATAKPIAVNTKNCIPKWSAPDAKIRLVIHVENPGSRKRTDTVGILTCKNVLLFAEGQEISVKKLKLFRNGKSVPVQVDAKNNEGFYVKRNSDTIGSDDEICFPLPFRKGENSCELVLYLDGKPTPEKMNSFIVKEIKERTPEKPYTLLVGNDMIKLGCLGNGIGLLSIDDKIIYNGFRKHGHAFIPLLPLAWKDTTPPELLTSGPVRMLVGLRAKKKCDIEWSYGNQNKHFKDGLIKGMTVQRIYQMRPNSSVIQLSNHYKYDKPLRRVFNSTMWYNRLYLNWGGSIPPEKRKDKWQHPTKILTYPKQSKLISEVWNKLDRSKGIYSSWYTLWDTHTKCGYTLVADPKHVSMQSGALMVRYGNRHIPEHSLDIDFWLCAITDKESPTKTMEWSETLNGLQPEITIKCAEKLVD